MRKATVIGLVALAALAIGIARADDRPEIGAVVKDHTLKTIDGKTMRLSEFRNDAEGKGGKIVVVTFWSFKCPTGNRLMDKNKELADFCEKNDAVFIGVSSYGESRKKIEEFCGENKVTYPVVYDAGKAFARAMGVEVVSTTAVLDKDGKLAYYGCLVSLPDQETGKVTPYAKNAVEELVAGKEVSKAETDTYG